MTFMYFYFEIFETNQQTSVIGNKIEKDIYVNI